MAMVLGGGEELGENAGRTTMRASRECSRATMSASMRPGRGVDAKRAGGGVGEPGNGVIRTVGARWLGNPPYFPTSVVCPPTDASPINLRQLLLEPEM